MIDLLPGSSVMKDHFAKQLAALDSPIDDGYEIIPSDSDDLEVITRCIYVGTAGDIKIDTKNSTALVFKNATGFLPIRATKLYSTDTTATDILGLY